MSILIKGMDMPKNEPLLVKINPDGSVSTTAKNGYKKYEAVPVPPHGRLIDADALADKHFGKDYLEKAMTASKDEMGTALVNIPLVINNAPTIIEEER